MVDLMKLTGGLLFPSPVVMALLTSAAANRQFAKDTSSFFSTKLPSLRLQRTTKGRLVASGRAVVSYLNRLTHLQMLRISSDTCVLMDAQRESSITSAIKEAPGQSSRALFSKTSIRKCHKVC